ncbi:MAG: mechanosensitive ion channel [Deltaproteobacteria bacterium]|nr:MAG: mechanosensitive ion channel [Deltaproteobacteria bacterium]
MRRTPVPVFLLVAAVLLFPVLSGAQSLEERIPGTGAGPVLETAPVKLDGKVLFSVRGVTAYPAETRAKEISRRIRALARDERFSPQALRVVESADRSDIYAGDRFVFALVDADARVERVERPLLAKLYLERVADAVKAYRRDRDPGVLLNNTLYALVATALFAVFLFVLRWIFRRFDAMIERRIKAKLQDLEALSHRFLQAKQLWEVLRHSLRTSRIALILVGAYLYLNFVLSLYPWTRPFAEGMLSLLLDPLSAIGKGILASVPDLAFLAVLAVVTRFLLRSIRLFFVTVAQGTVKLSGFEPEWALPTYKIVRLTILAFAVVMAYPYIPGSSSGAFKGVSLFLGVILSLGSSSFIANIIAGYTMTYRRAFRLGDRIKVDDYTGDVVEIRNLVTHLRTPKNEEVVLPNSVILNSHVVNYSALAKKQGLILHTTVGIGYETPWRQVEAMLLMSAERTPGLLREPPPFVLAKSLGDFAVSYELNVHCDDPAAMPRLYSALHLNILDVFNEYGIQIMTPAYEGDPEQAKIVPREQWYASPATGPSDDTPA